MSHRAGTQTCTFLPCLKFCSGASGGLQPYWPLGAGLPILWRHGLENKREKQWNGAPGTPEASGELGSGCQLANEAKRAWVKLEPSCRAHQSLRRSKNALGEVSIRSAHKNTGLWPLKPFLSWILPHFHLSLLHLGDWGQHVLLFHLRTALATTASGARPLSHSSSHPGWIRWKCFLECWSFRSQLLFNAEWKCWC